MIKLKLSVMLILFYGIKGITMSEWVPEGHTVNQQYYIKVLRKRVRKKRLNLWKNKGWILHQDNSSAHNVFSVKEFLADEGIPVFARLSTLWLLPVPNSEKCI